MKAYIVTDTHLGISNNIKELDDSKSKSYPAKVEWWLDKVILPFFDQVFFPYVERTFEEGDVILHLGDFYHPTTDINIRALYEGWKIMKRMADIAPLHMIIGNHDIYGEKVKEINTLCWANDLDNVTLYENPKEITFGDRKCLFLPWVRDISILNDQLRKFNGEIIFCHSDLKGAKLNRFKKMESGLSEEHFTPFKQVWSGHIHLVQKIKNIQFAGSPYHTTRSDIGDDKGFWTLDFETLDYNFIENKVSPRFLEIEINTEEDLKKLKSDDWKGNRVDLNISNKLFFKNKRIRNKIQSLIDKHKFEKVDWIDDMKFDPEKGKEIISKLKEFQGGENIREFIYKYINDQDFKNNKMKNRTLDILEKAFKITENA